MVEKFASDPVLQSWTSIILSRWHGLCQVAEGADRAGRTVQRTTDAVAEDLGEGAETLGTTLRKEPLSWLMLQRGLERMCERILMGQPARLGERRKRLRVTLVSTSESCMRIVLPLYC